MKLQMFGTVGRATVPADTGRHGGRPYVSTRLKFFFRSDWPLFWPVAKLVLNIEYRTRNIECWSVESLRSDYFRL